MRKKRSRFVCCISNQLFDMWNLNLDLLNHWHGSSWLRGESSHQKTSSAEVFGLQPFDLRRRIDPGTEWDRPSLKNHWRRKILWIVSPNLRKHIVSDKFNIAMEAMARLHMIYWYLLLWRCWFSMSHQRANHTILYCWFYIQLHPHYIPSKFGFNSHYITCPLNSHYIPLHSH